MTRYVAMRPRADYYDETSDAVIQANRPMLHETDHAPAATGLLDASGNELFRVHDKRAMGFLAREGWGG